jgi:hypothetical protein
MALALLKEPPLSPPADLGPYRRQDYETLPDEPRCELILPEIQIDLAAFWKKVEEDLA